MEEEYSRLQFRADYRKHQVHMLLTPTTVNVFHATSHTLTCVGPNHTAANLGGTPKMNTCDEPTIVCPTNVSQKRSGAAETHLMTAPIQLPNAPIRLF